MHIARFEKRLFAYLFDLIISYVFSYGLIFLVPNSIVPFYRIIFVQVFSSLFYLILTVPLMLLTNGFTLGGAMVGIHTTCINDEKLSLLTIFRKMLGLSILPLAFINAISMLIVHEQRTIFDKFTDTIVIDKTCY